MGFPTTKTIGLVAGMVQEYILTWSPYFEIARPCCEVDLDKGTQVWVLFTGLMRNRDVDGANVPQQLM